MMFITSLSEEILFRIAELLSFSDLKRLQCVGSKKLMKVAADEVLWQRFCLLHFDVSQKTEKSWQATFRSYYGSFGRYIHCYKRIKQAWDRIFQLTQQRIPSVYHSLLPGVSEEVFDQVEAKVNSKCKSSSCKFSEDFRCSYRICNGQDYFSLTAETPGLFGTASDTGRGIFMWSLKPFRSETMTHEEFTACLNRFVELEPKTRVRLFPISVVQCYSLNFVNYVIMEPTLHSGVVTLMDEVGLVDRIAPSFEDFICDFAYKYLPRFDIENNRILRFLPIAQKETQIFKVEIAKKFLSSFYYQDSFVFSFKIKVTMKADASKTESCQVEAHEMTTSHPRVGVVGPLVSQLTSSQHVVRFTPGTTHSFNFSARFPTKEGTVENKLHVIREQDEVLGVIDCGSVNFCPDGECFWIRNNFEGMTARERDKLDWVKRNIWDRGEEN